MVLIRRGRGGEPDRPHGACATGEAVSPATLAAKGPISPLRTWLPHPTRTGMRSSGVEQYSSLRTTNYARLTRLPDEPLPMTIKGLEHGARKRSSLAHAACNKPLRDMLGPRLLAGLPNWLPLQQLGRSLFTRAAGSFRRKSLDLAGWMCINIVMCESPGEGPVGRGVARTRMPKRVPQGNVLTFKEATRAYFCQLPTPGEPHVKSGEERRFSKAVLVSWLARRN